MPIYSPFSMLRDAGFIPMRLIPSGLATLAVCLLPLSLDAAPPLEPSVVVFDEASGQTIGKPGGELSTLVGKPKDTRLMVVYGYARLVGYDRAFAIQPDILKAVEVEEGRIFTLRLRKDHRWSDGEPFTSEDFRYWWEDVANNMALSPTGPPAKLVVDGEAPEVTFPDALTVRYSWSKPNPLFLPALAGAAPQFIFMPSHYLKQFHKTYADGAKLNKAVTADNARDWAQLHGRRDNMYKLDNPDLPTLQPWMLTTSPPATRFVFERNPNYHRVDEQGQQLPYIDRVVMEVVDSKLIPIKAGAGETDLQARGLFFKHYTFLKENENRSGLETLLWQTARGAHLALYPNLNASDPVWREVLRDVRFRRALSLSINRDEINQIMYFGLAMGGNNTVLPQSPLYKEDYRFTWAAFDPDQASTLLDEAGLSEWSSDGLRLLPDGRPVELIVETAGEETEETDLLELVAEAWQKQGIKIHVKPSQREVLRNRIFAGDTLMSISYGLENGIPTADMSPWEFAPTSQFDQYQWPKWGQHWETKGEAGSAPDMPEAKELLSLFQSWQAAQAVEEREAIWHNMLEIYNDQVYSIGLASGVFQPVVAKTTLNNVPAEGVYNWEPGAHFGIYRPDTFWFDE
ncbi:MAG: ABC transporter substrate-binding protein [Geminicoccaceae bacterium]